MNTDDDLPGYVRCGYILAIVRERVDSPDELLDEACDVGFNTSRVNDTGQVRLKGTRGTCKNVHIIELSKPYRRFVDAGSRLNDSKPDLQLAGPEDALGTVKALAMVVAKEKAKVTGRMYRELSSGLAVVKLVLHLPRSLWGGLHGWKPSPASIFVFTHLAEDEPVETGLEGAASGFPGHFSPSSDASSNFGGCGVLGCQLHPGGGHLSVLVEGGAASNSAPQEDAAAVGELEGEEASESHAATENGAGGADAGREAFVLANLFKSLPSHLEEDAHFPEGTHESSQRARSATAQTCALCSLPEDSLLRILRALARWDLVQVGRTCHFLRSAAENIIPGLGLQMFPHQRAAVRWMLRRELPARLPPMPHPHIRHLRTRCGLTYSASLATGKVTDAPPPQVLDVRGGLFCDDPGLGKTVTGLALMLKTLGTLPTAPSGSTVTRGVSAQGRPMACYVESNSSLDTARWEEPRSPATPGGESPNSCGRITNNNNNNNNSNSNSKGKRRRDAADRSSASGGDANGAQGVAGDETADWIQCDACDKWRRLPPGHQYNPEDMWFCGMHPHAGRDACNSPEEWADAVSREGSELVSAPGYLLIPQGRRGGRGGQGSQRAKSSRAWEAGDVDAANVAHFLHLLRQKCPPWSAQRSAPQHAYLDWLLKQDPAALHSDGPGLKVPNFLQKSGASLYDRRGAIVFRYEELFESFGLERVEPGAGRRGAKRARRDVKSGKSPGQAPHTWRQPAVYRHLSLDLVSLAAAAKQAELTDKKQESQRKNPLANVQPGTPRRGVSASDQSRASAAEAPRRFFLSSATLVVVPATLLTHWRQQVEKHVLPNKDGEPLLRVCVFGDGDKQLTVQQLAWEYDLVLTTFTRLSADWGKADSDLLQVHWLRVVLDEGHVLGASLGITNRQQFACALRAERRWVMTGTPTPHTVAGDDVKKLQPLLAFLHHQPYDKVCVWNKAVMEPWRARQWEARARLASLLHRCMIRACKDNLRSLPSCTRTVTVLSFSPAHAQSYNELVDVVHRNLLLADWNDEDHVESLLNSKNSKLSREMLKNVRLSCCVAGNCNLLVNEEDVKSTLELVADHQVMPLDTAPTPPWVGDDHKLSLIDRSLRHGGECQRCRTWHRFPLATPCAHVLCLSCVALDKTRCGLCNEPFKMQGVDDAQRKKLNSNPKWEVPIELIEFQPSYAQAGAAANTGGHWQPNWAATESTKCEHLVQRLKETRVLLDVYGDNYQGSSCSMGSANAMTTAESASRPVKAIVFSQFWMHLQLVDRQLQSLGTPVAFLHGSLPPAQKQMVIARFRDDPDVRVLLMDTVGSVGLDLSFVSFVFLMEPIADRSLEDQVVSRAHRMGATDTVAVETLAMQGTVEEEMLQLLQNGVNASPRVEGSRDYPSSSTTVVPSARRQNGELAHDLQEGEELEGIVESRVGRNRLFMHLRNVPVAATHVDYVPIGGRPYGHETQANGSMETVPEDILRRARPQPLLCAGRPSNYEQGTNQTHFAPAESTETFSTLPFPDSTHSERRVRFAI